MYDYDYSDGYYDGRWGCGYNPPYNYYSRDSYVRGYFAGKRAREMEAARKRAALRSSYHAYYSGYSNGFSDGWNAARRYW